MRWASTLREAALDVQSGTTKATMLGCVLFAVVLVLGLAEIGTMSQLLTAADVYRRAGGATLVYIAPQQIDGPACDRLTTIPGIDAAGAMRPSTENERLLALPSSSVPTFEASPGFSGFVALDAPRPHRGVLVSAALAEALELDASDKLPLMSGTVEVGAVFTSAEDGRRPGLGYALIAPTAAIGPFDECWIDTWPQSQSSTDALRTVLLPGAGATDASPPRLAQLNSTLGAHFDGAARYAERLSRFAPLVGIVIAAAIGFVATRTRRIELASARHAGVPVGSQVLQLVCETLCWAVGAAVMAVSAILLLLEIAPQEGLGVVAGIAIRPAVVAVPAVLCGVIGGVALTKEEQLFRYFKER